jgi:dihydroorotate dehydrogenase
LPVYQNKCSSIARIFASQMYKFLRSLLFLFSPETAHSISMGLLKWFCSIGFLKKMFSKIFTYPSLPVHLFGLTFKNPVGLGAGFDKNAKYLKELEALGFGFVEIGTVTPLAQPGNDKPRVFRLVKDKALINRMGFNNEGVELIAERLKKWKEAQQRDTNSSLAPDSYRDHHLRMIIGGNIGKNKITPNEDAWKDYEICFKALHPYVDFFVVNVSSPNTPGLRALQEKESLKKILTHLQNLNSGFEIQKPILLKIAPDLESEQIDDVIDLAKEINLDGLVATNTTVSRDQLQTPNSRLQTIGAGGLSGKPLQKRSTEIVQYIRNKTDNKIPILASGGIFNGRDAKEKINAGASLVEVWTGFIYEGPFIVKRICKELA